MPPLQRTLDLPPPFRLLALREAGDAFAHASAHALELGAATLVFVGRFDLAEFAVVLEPEEELASARRSIYAGMVALADALAALALPETSVMIEWPDALVVDGGLVGGGRLAWPPATDEQAVADWLVFGAVIRLDDGFAGLAAERLAEGFARHLMVTIDRWQEGDFAGVAQAYLARLKPERGARNAIDLSGNLRIERPGEAAVCLDLRPALAEPSWLRRLCGQAP